MDEPLQNGSVLLHDPAEGRWLFLQRPVKIHVANSVEAVTSVLRQVQREVDEHALYAAGFLAYEAAAAFDPSFRTHGATGFPLAWFGLYDELQETPGPASPTTIVPPLPWQMAVSPQEYQDAVAEIRDYIRAGDTYQVNYTVRLRAPFVGDPASLFAPMIQAQGPQYAAYLNTDDWSICCASPELFFRLNGTEILCRPMKGTAPRGLWPAQDHGLASELQRSHKNRAENVMIVDMVRNDLGRVAQTGSVQVEQLFQVERYPTLWQMTSTVRATTTATVPDIMGALFPPASITGAPKIRTMEIIAGLEKSPRRIYTGAIGFIAPHRQAQFNVAIRTVLVDKKSGQAEYGVGGGIVWDSIGEEEFAECQTKARILTNPLPSFTLLETILWKPPSGYWLLELHLRRLAESAEYFFGKFGLDDIRKQLADLEPRLPRTPQRVRLTVGPQGQVALNSEPLLPLSSNYRVAPAAAPIASQDVFLYHKTTNRQAYERALASRPGCQDVLLWNEKQELTESTIANLVVEKSGRLLTPPIECGLLPGVYRAFLLEQGTLKEERIRLPDLAHCTKIYLINSVRGMWAVSYSQRVGV